MSASDLEGESFESESEIPDETYEFLDERIKSAAGINRIKYSKKKFGPERLIVDLDNNVFNPINVIDRIRTYDENTQLEINPIIDHQVLRALELFFLFKYESNEKAYPSSIDNTYRVEVHLKEYNALWYKYVIYIEGHKAIYFQYGRRRVDLNSIQPVFQLYFRDNSRTTSSNSTRRELHIRIMRFFFRVFRANNGAFNDVHQDYSHVQHTEVLTSITPIGYGFSF